MNRKYQHNKIGNNHFFKQTAAGKSLLKAPLGFIDIGARGGTHEIVHAIAEYTSVICFEADKQECERLQKHPEVSRPWHDIKIIPTALSNRRGDSHLYLLSTDTNHSLYPPNTGFTERYNMEKWVTVGKTSLQTNTLDNILFSNTFSHNAHTGELIKLDTQGTEYEILQGAEKTLAENTVAILTEVSFSELYKGQKLFSEIEILLREQGFTFYGFAGNIIHNRSCKLLDKKHHTTAERAIFADAVFFKDPLSGTTFHQTLSSRQQYSLFICALLFGYFDFALELADKTWASNDKQEQHNIKTLINALSYYDPAISMQTFKDALHRMQNDPDSSNIIAGKLTDERRYINNFHDIFNVSTLPDMK